MVDFPASYVSLPEGNISLTIWHKVESMMSFPFFAMICDRFLEGTLDIDFQGSPLLGHPVC